MTKLEELKTMIRAWKVKKSLTLAHDICEYLADNLDIQPNPEKMTVEEFNDLSDEDKTAILDGYRFAKRYEVGE